MVTLMLLLTCFVGGCYWFCLISFCCLCSFVNCVLLIIWFVLLVVWWVDLHNVWFAMVLTLAYCVCWC